MKKDFQCDFNFKLVYSLLLAACLPSKAKLKLSVHRAIKPQRWLRHSSKTLQLLAKILRTLLHQQRPVVVANEVVDAVVDTNWVVDVEAGGMEPVSQPAQPYKANFQFCQSALRAILLGAKTTYLRCSHHLVATHPQSAKPSAARCWVAGMAIKVRQEVFRQEYHRRSWARQRLSLYSKFKFYVNRFGN